MPSAVTVKGLRQSGLRGREEWTVGGRGTEDVRLGFAADPGAAAVGGVATSIAGVVIEGVAALALGFGAGRGGGASCAPAEIRDRMNVVITSAATAAPVTTPRRDALRGGDAPTTSPGDDSVSVSLGAAATL